MRKLFDLLGVLLLVVFTGCSDSSSSVSMTDSEVYESRLEKFVEEENPYAFLPDGVRMDDTEHVYEVVPDSEGMIDLESSDSNMLPPQVPQHMFMSVIRWRMKEETLITPVLRRHLSQTVCFRKAPSISD